MSDRVYQQLREHLAYLKLAAVAEQLAAALERAETGQAHYTRFLHDLLARRGPQRPSNAGSTAGCGSRASPRTRRSSSSTSPPNPHSTAGSSTSSRRCASCRRKPTCC